MTLHKFFAGKAMHSIKNKNISLVPTHKILILTLRGFNLMYIERSF